MSKNNTSHSTGESLTPQHERPEQYSRDYVVEVLSKLRESKHLNHPDDLPLEDPEVVEAHRILDSWWEQAQAAAHESPSAAVKLELDLGRTTIYVDAGFNDPDYLDEVANDFLVQDEESARSQGLEELADKIKAKEDEIISMIPQKES